MPEDTVWTLAADGDDVLSVLDEIDASMQAMSDGMDAAVSAMDEQFAGLTDAVDGMTATIADSAASMDELGGALGATADAASTTADALTNLQSANDAMGATLSEDNQIISDLNEQVTNLTAQLQALASSESEAAGGADATAASMDGEAASATSMGDALDAAMGPLMMMGMAAGMAGAKFIGMGLDGQKAEALLTGMAGASQQDIQALQQSAMDLGVSMTDAAAGFYQVESAGYSGSAAITVFTAAEKLALGGQMQASDAMSALTAIMHDYSAKATDATHYTDMMAEAVLRGKQSAADFASSIGPLASAGENVGLSFQQVAAAEATMTQINPHVRQDAMQLAGLFQSLDPAIGGVAAKAHKLKIGFDEAHYSSLDLLGKLQYLAEIAGGTNTAAFVKLTGGVRGSTAAIDLLKGGAASFKGNLEAMSHATGATQKAFDTFEQTVPAHLDKVGAALSVFATRFMDAIGPYVIPIIDGFTAAIGAFAAFISQHMDIVMPILVGLAAVIGTVLVLAIGAFLAPLGVLIATFWPFILAIAAVGAGLMLLIAHWNAVVQALHLTGPIQAVATLFHNLADSISVAFGAMHRSADEQTLRMKLATIDHTKAMAQGNIENIAHQEQAIGEEMRKTTNNAQRHMLEMKLQALEQSQQQAEGVVKNMTKERLGVEQQLMLMDPAAHLHMLTMKDQSLTLSQQQAEGTVAHIQMEARGIEQQLQRTSDAHTRGMLEMKLKALSSSETMAQGVVKHVKTMRSGVEKQMSGLHAQIDSENSNWILRTIGFFQQLGSSIAGGFRSAAAVILPFLQQIGTFIVTNFLPVWLQLVTMWHTQLLPLFAQLWGAIQPLMPILADLAAFIGALLVGVLGILVGVITGVIKGLAGFLSGLMIVIGGVVQLFTGVVQVFSGLLSFFVDLFTGHFNKLSGDLGMIWQGILNIFLGGAKAIGGIFQTLWYTVAGLVGGFVQGIIGFFTTLWDELVGHSIVPDMVNGIIGWFTQLGTRALSLVSGLISGVTSLFTGLVAQATSWGADLIGNLLSGIQSAAGNIGSVVGGIAQHIASFLHFSKPDQGPLADADKFMPDMMDLFARGMTDNIGKIKQAVSGVALEVSHGLAPQGGGMGSAGGSLGAASHTALLQQMVHLLQQQGRGQTGHAPVPPSFSQNNSFNLHGGGGTQNLQELYQILNMLGGVQQEYGNRGIY